MRNHRNIVLCGAAAAAAGLLAATPASAQFYKGRTLNVIINYGAGGNTDVQGRTLMRYMEKYIPGKPRIVIRNMPGAGGGVAANYMNKGAKNDGTMMGVFTTPWMHELVGSGVLTASLKNLTYIGAIGQQQIAHVRKDIGDGINSPAEFVKVTKSFKSAGHSPTTSKDIAIKVTLGLLGMKHEHVSGFKSASPIRRAIMQNEVQYTEDSLAGYFGGVVPNLISKGVSIPLWHNGVLNKDGTMDPSPSVSKDIPTFFQVYQMKHGKDAMPSGPEWEVYKKITGARVFLRTIVMPAGVPKEAVEALRGAWLKVVKDKEYNAEYAKKNRSPLEWKSGEQADAAIKDILTIDPKVKDWLQKMAGVKK